MKKLLPLLLLFVTTLGVAQKNSDIKGVLTDSTDQPLIGASAILYFQKDSIFTGFSLTDDTGKFQINTVAPGDYYLQLSYVGYVPLNKSLDRADFDGSVDLGKVILKPNTDLEAIIVTNAPLEVRKDTIVYDADAFQTKENATVEDLLKQLPGLEVEDDGSITAQGETVQRVLVDGKKFFGDDPKIATQNLPADAIKSVEVYDKKSEKAEFTGVDDGQEEKTINLELKADRKNGYFGNVNAGGGVEDNQNDGLYEGKALLSRFSPSNQISVLASSNNVNNQAFSTRDYFAMSGQSFGGRGGGANVNTSRLPNANLNSGINRSTVTGANWNTTFGEKVDFHTDYFFNQTNNNFARNITREYFQNVGDLDYSQVSNGEDITSNHRLNMDLTAKLNKRNELKLENQFSFANSDQQSFEDSQTIGANGELTNANTTFNNIDGDNLALASDLFWKHRFQKEGRSLFMNVGFQNTNTDQTQFTDAETLLAIENEVNTLEQDLVNDYAVNTWRGDISYTEPLFDKHYVEMNYVVSNETEDRAQDFFDLSNGQRELNQDLSNQFARDYVIHRPGTNYKILGEKHDFTFGLAYELANLEGVTSLSNLGIDRNFNQLLPSLSWNYDIQQGKSLRINYNASQNAPSVSQLQPAVNNTNPLNIYQGNPNLDAEVNHSVFSNFFSFDRFTFTSLFANLGMNYTTNNIVNAQSFNEDLVQTTMPVNVDSQTSLFGGLSYGKPIRAIRMRMRSRINSNFTDGILFLNGEENEFTRWSNTVSLSLDNTNNEKFDYGVSMRLSDNTTTYSENERNNQDYLNQFYSAEVEYRGMENWRIGSEFDYRFYGQATPNSTSQELPIWEASVSHLFADNLGEVKLSMYDLLNRNTGVSQSQNLNYAQEEISNALGRYGIIGFTWKIIDKAGKEDREAADRNKVPTPAPPKKTEKKKDAPPTEEKDNRPPPPPPPPMN